jgi:hypothetical protein
MAEQHDVGSPPSAPPPRRTRRWYRRPVLIVPLVLIAAISVVLVILYRSGNTSTTKPPTVAQPDITVNGTVLDSITGRPLAAAVTAAGHSTRTNAHGAFRLPGVRPNAALTIRSRNYAAATVPAAPGPATIRLTPIPVRVKVTSALTGVPLPAAIRTPDRTRIVASAAGAATVYRVGPGDRVTVTAAGYRPATVPVAANRTIRATLQPLAWKTAAAQILVWLKTKKYAALANWVFSPATGYQYYPGQPTTSSGIVAVTAQVVGVDATVHVGVIPYGHLDISASFEGSGTTVTLAGQRARHGTIHFVGGPAGAPPRMGTDWYRNPLVISVVGDDLAATDKIMTGILAALPSN